ncbi:hypothetical protein LguiA_009043 [Lonicera macranthoides]
MKDRVNKSSSVASNLKWSECDRMMNIDGHLGLTCLNKLEAEGTSSLFKPSFGHCNRRNIACEIENRKPLSGMEEQLHNSLQVVQVFEEMPMSKSQKPMIR